MRVGFLTDILGFHLFFNLHTSCLNLLSHIKLSNFIFKCIIIFFLIIVLPILPIFTYIPIILEQSQHLQTLS